MRKDNFPTSSFKTIPILPHFIPLPPSFKMTFQLPCKRNNTPRLTSLDSDKQTIARSKSFEFHNSNSGGNIKYEGESELFLDFGVR